MITKYQNLLAWALGIGIVSFAFRDYYFNGTVIGLSICTIVLFLMLIMYRADKPKNVLGSKFVWIPLLLICLSIVISGIFVYFGDKNFNILLTRITIAVIFFGVYLACRVLGERVFKPFAWAVVIEAISVVIFSLFVHYGVRNGGIAGSNYNVPVCLMTFGAVVSVCEKKWWIVTIALIGIFFTGAEEGLVAVAIIFLAILIRRDFSLKLVWSILITGIIVLLGVVPFNYTRDLYAVPIEEASELFTHASNPQAMQFINNPSNESFIPVKSGNSTINYLTDGRWNFMIDAFKKWDWLGSGYVMNPVDKVDQPIYNVPIVIAEQVGIWASLAWLIVIVYCLKKTKWKYAFIALIALGLFDNIMFCQLGCFIFVLIGISTVSTRKTDLVFRKINEK